MAHLHALSMQIFKTRILSQKTSCPSTSDYSFIKRYKLTQTIGLCDVISKNTWNFMDTVHPQGHLQAGRNGQLIGARWRVAPVVLQSGSPFKKRYVHS